MIAITALMISLAVAIIAALQWRVADNKLRLDLFERRYKVYEATLAFVRVSVQDFAHIDQHLMSFDHETSKAEFLFDVDVVDYLRQIRERAIDKDLLWLSNQFTPKTNIFASYLRFADIKSKFIPSLMNSKCFAREWLYLLAGALFGLLAMPSLVFVGLKLFYPATAGTFSQLYPEFFSALAQKQVAPILWLIVVGPYLFFQLIRTVIRAWKTIRSP
jgi:hypothetical protein